MALLADFRTRFPEFAAIADARVQLFLDDAELLMADPDKWLDFYDVAHEYFAAHLLYVGHATSTGDGGIIAPVKKQEVDDVMLEHAIGDIEPSRSELFATAYGKRYWSYRRLVTITILGV